MAPNPRPDPIAFYRSQSVRDDHTAPRFVARRLQDVLRSGTPAGAVIDVGCGVGANLMVLLGDGIRAVGVDVSERALAEARAAGASVAVADAAHLPFPDRAFGLAVLTEVLEHVARPERIVSEVARVLRPGGLLFVSSPNYANAAGLRKLWHDRRSGRHDWNPWGAHRGGYEGFVTRGSLRALLREAFEISWEEGYDPGLGLTGGLQLFARFAATSRGKRAMDALWRGPLAPNRRMAKALAMTTVVLARRRTT